MKTLELAPIRFQGWFCRYSWNLVVTDTAPLSSYASFFSFFLFLFCHLFLSSLIDLLSENSSFDSRTGSTEKERISPRKTCGWRLPTHCEWDRRCLCSHPRSYGEGKRARKLDLVQLLQFTQNIPLLPPIFHTGFEYNILKLRRKLRKISA